MASSMNILYIIFGIILMIFTINIFFNFYGIEFESYGNYLLWFIALAVFYVVLPSSETNIFN